MSVQKQYVGYYCTLTEYESGWGSRSDGVLVASSLDAIKSRVTTIENHASDDFTRADHEPKTVILTNEAVEKLNNSPDGVIWCTARDFKSLRKDV